MVKIIAEVGSVHDGSIGNAIKLVSLASECGADAIKFQTHIAKHETTKSAPSPSYFHSETRYDYFKRTAFSFEQWLLIKQECDKLDIEFISSPFSEQAFQLLEKLDISTYKIPSGEITNLPLLEKVAESGKNIILSSGMSNWDELDSAVNLVLGTNKKISLLQCTSKYPCPYESVGINVMEEMSKRYKLTVGLSDHTITNYAAFLAVSKGAEIIEKHLTFSKKMYGSDALNSAEPAQFTDLCEGIRAIEKMNESIVDKSVLDKDIINMKNIFQKSIVAIEEIEIGKTLTNEMLALKKPGLGLDPSKLKLVIGRKAKRLIKEDTYLTEEDIVW